MRVLNLLFLFSAVIGCCTALYERWLPNTDLINPHNWDAGRVPCGNDRAIIPDDSPVVFYQTNTTISELVLPKNGEMVFGSYAILAFTNEPDHSADCLGSGGDVHFNASRPADWVDPNNWCPADTEKGPCKAVAQLDSEKIPCSTDHVIFPTGSSYYVNLGSALSIIVNTLKVSGKAYSTESFSSFLNTDNGKNIFPVPPGGQMSGVTIQRQLCTDASSCACGNDRGPILDAVCRLQSPRCQRPRCTSAFRPVGHCCDICGAMLNITYGLGFDFNKLKTGLQRNCLDGKDAFKNVIYIVSKRTDGKIQVVLMDGDGQQASKAGNAMMNELTDDINTGGFKYGINQVNMQSSVAGAGSGTGSGGSTSAHTGKAASLPGGEVAGITIGVIVAAVVLLGLAFFAYRRKGRIPDDLGFRVFDRFNLSQRRKPQVSVPPSVGFTFNSPDNVGFSQGFDNPMYGSTPLQVVKAMEMTPTSYGDPMDQQPIDDSRGFDNPLYENQESLFTDPTKVDNSELDTVMTISGANKGGKHGDTDA